MRRDTRVARPASGMNELTHQLLLILLEAGLVAGLLLALFAARRVLGFASLYTTVGVLYYLATLLAGHRAGLMLAHDRAITCWGDYRNAARSQYWMLAVMVAFTCFGLFLLSVSNA